MADLVVGMAVVRGSFSASASVFFSSFNQWRRYDTGPILIGWVGPLSAGAVSEGQEMLAASQIAVDQVNAAGGVLGRPLELVIRDTMADPETGAEAMKDLIDNEGVVAVIGEVHSGVAMSEIEIAHERGVPFLVSEAWSDEVTAAGYDEVFRIAPANSQIYENVSAWIAGAGFGEVSIIVEDTGWGSNVTSVIETTFGGASINYTVLRVDPENIDIPAVVADLGPADLIMVLISTDTAYPLISAICDEQLAPTSDTALYIGAGPGVVGSLWDQVGDCGQYAIAEDLVPTKTQWNDLAAGLVEEMAASGLTTAIGGFAGFDSVWLMADAIERAGSTDSGDIIAALAATEFIGARGQYSFGSERGDWRFHHFLGAPLTIIQYLEVGQTPDEAAILSPDEWATIRDQQFYTP